jgi:hypothetical protein
MGLQVHITPVVPHGDNMKLKLLGLLLIFIVVGVSLHNDSKKKMKKNLITDEDCSGLESYQFFKESELTKKYSQKKLSNGIQEEMNLNGSHISSFSGDCQRAYIKITVVASEESEGGAALSPLKMGESFLPNSALTDYGRSMKRRLESGLKIYQEKIPEIKFPIQFSYRGFDFTLESSDEKTVSLSLRQIHPRGKSTASSKTQSAPSSPKKKNP